MSSYLSSLGSAACWAWMCRKRFSERRQLEVSQEVKARSQTKLRTNIQIPKTEQLHVLDQMSHCRSLSNISTHVMCDGAVRHWAHYNAAAAAAKCQKQEQAIKICAMQISSQCVIASLPSQCPSQVAATGQSSWLHPSWSALLHSFLKASKATFSKASKTFGSFMAFLSYPSLHPIFTEVSWPCLSHAVKTNITWVKILKSCSLSTK